MSQDCVTIFTWTCDGCKTKQVSLRPEAPYGWRSGPWRKETGKYDDHCSACHKTALRVQYPNLVKQA